MAVEHTDELFIKRIRDLARLSERRGMMACSDFLTLYEQNMLRSVSGSLDGVVVTLSGGYPEAERRLAAFCPEGMGVPERLPISCLQIRPRSARFAEKMTHRDYLGALIHLGTNRSVLGDILTDENMAYVFCLERMAPFILDHLEKVRNNPVTVTLVEDPADFPGPKLMTAAGSIASVRLDNLVSLFLGESRTKAAGLISGGQVYVDGRLVSRCGYEPKEGERISVRGYGRFRFTEVRGTTRKGRVNVALEKYV